MTGNKYIIIGAEVDQAEAFLHDDGSITDKKGADGVPLNVEFIGRLMVELSQRGKSGVPRAELEAHEDRVRRALVVQDFSTQSGGAALSDAEREAILAGTTVRIEFESRRRGSKKPDRNTRILVVPSDETLAITDKLFLTTSRDILDDRARGAGPDNAIVALGCAGWGTGQLEHELTENDWLTAPADAQLLFSEPLESRWQAAAGRIGVDFAHLADYAGHA